jgi:hypothetical protein
MINVLGGLDAVNYGWQRADNCANSPTGTAATNCETARSSGIKNPEDGFYYYADIDGACAF